MDIDLNDDLVPAGRVASVLEGIVIVQVCEPCLHFRKSVAGNMQWPTCTPVDRSRSLAEFSMRGLCYAWKTARRLAE